MIISTLCALPFTAHALGLDPSGNCGYGVSYTFNSTYGILNINYDGSDTGRMFDYDASPSPFENKSAIKTIYINEGVTKIGAFAFYDCVNLEKVVVYKDTLTTIGSCAFKGCTSLKTVDLSKKTNISSMGSSVFSGCTSLKEFTVPDGVSTVNEYTFLDCTSLKCVTLPASVTAIKSNAFSGCTALTDVFFKGTQQQLNKVTIASGNDAIYTADLQTQSWGGIIGDNAVYVEKEVDDATTVRIKGTGATYDYWEVDSGNPLSNNVNCVFVSVDDGITSIGDYLFYNCDYLYDVYIPATVTSIGDYAFHDCQKIKRVWYDGTKSQLTNITKSTGNSELLNAPSFYQTTGKCGTNISYRFSPITQVLTIDGTGAMQNYASSSAQPWAAYRDKISALVISDGITSIGDYAFASLPITTLTTPATTTKIGKYAFAFCTDLENITVNGTNCVIEEKAFTDGSGKVDKITLNGVKSVGTYAFFDVWSNSIDLGTVEEIGYAAFDYNEKVTSIEVPETCKSVDEAAFNACKKLTDIYFYNDDCVISDEASTIPEATVIHGRFGSTASTYAYNNKRTFVTMPCKDGKHSTVDNGKIIATTATTYTRQHTCELCGATYTQKYNKSANTLTVKGKTKTVKYKTVKKKNVTVKRADVLAVSKNKGIVTYAKSSGNAKITVNKKNGNVTVKKGLKKGTYKVKVKVTAAGTNTYKKVTKTVTFTIKVK